MTLLPDRKPESSLKTESTLTLTCFTAWLPNMIQEGCDGTRSLRVNTVTGEVVDEPVNVDNFSDIYTYRVDPKELGTSSHISAITAAHNNNVHPRAIVFGDIG